MERYSEKDILREVGGKAFEAARHYVREGRVLAFEQDDDVVSGQVLGTRTPALRADDHDRGHTRRCQHLRGMHLPGRLQLQACRGCPPLWPSVGEDHRFPVVGGAHRPDPLGASTALSPDRPPAKRPMPGLAAWLDDLDRAQATAEEGYPASIAQRLVYVLSPIPFGHGVPRLGFRAISARLLKDGRFSDSSRPYEISAALSGTPAKFLRPSDLRILRAVTLLRRTYGSSGLPTASLTTGA